jgi:hypothetical protein
MTLISLKIAAEFIENPSLLSVLNTNVSVKYKNELNGLFSLKACHEEREEKQYL